MRTLNPEEPTSRYKPSLANLALTGISLALAYKSRKLQLNLSKETKIASFLEERLALAQNMNRHDSKTKLLTFPAFHAEVTKRTSSTRRADEKNKSHALLFVDIDDFKQLNNHLTHLVADKTVLLPVSECIQSSVRHESDLTSRFGGEEFIIFLDNAGEEGARLVSEKLQSKVNALHPYPDSPNGLGITIAYQTFSQGGNIDGVLEQLSGALIQAKEIDGKNQIVTPGQFVV